MKVTLADLQNHNFHPNDTLRKCESAAKNDVPVRNNL